MRAFSRCPSANQIKVASHRLVSDSSTSRYIACFSTATPAQQLQSSSIRGPPCFTLEASVGAANPLDLELLSNGVFGAEVHPDLPIATTWYALGEYLELCVYACKRVGMHADCVNSCDQASCLHTLFDSAAVYHAVAGWQQQPQ
jgi:hypothetical protein